LIFNRTDALLYEGAVTGAGNLMQAGGGTLTLTGDSSYAGTTSIIGTLQLGNGGTTGSIGGSQINNGGLLVFNRSDSLTLSTPISGAGVVQQAGGGITILTADETYTGGTAISAGTLQLGNGGTAGSIQGDVTDNGVLAFNRSDTVTYAGVISGTGGANQTGTGTLILTGENTYTGATTVSAGTLQIGDGGTAGSIAGALVDNAAAVFNRTDALTYGGAISGTGTLTQAGTGTLILTGNSTFAGTTTISSGVLQIGSGGTSGSLSGAMVDNAVLAFNRTDSSVYSGAISGTGVVRQIGSGTTVFTGASTYTGGTTIAAGTLQIGNNGTTGSIAGNVADSGTLAFARSDAVTFAGVVSGTGALVQRGTGTLTLTGANTYTGATTVSSGTLLVNGSIAGTTTVASGATIGGSGTVGALVVQNGGTVAPGNSLGTLNVAGALTLNPSSIYAMEITSTGHDLLQVSGSAQLAGTVAVMGPGTSFSTTPVAILSASSVTGQFGAITASGIGGNIPILTYDATHAYLTVSPSINSQLPGTEAATNRGRVAGAMDFAMIHDGAAVFAPLSALSASALDATLAQISNETAAAIRTSQLAAVDKFTATLLDPSAGGRYGLAGGNGMRLLPGDGQRSHQALSLWSTIYGDRHELSGAADQGSHHVAGTDLGVIVGIDYRSVNGKGAMGFAAGWNQQNWKLSNALGVGHTTDYQFGVYYSREFDSNYLALALAYAGYYATAVRHVAYNGDNVYGTDFNASGEALRAEFGHMFELENSVLTPYVLFQVQDLGMPDYAETVIAGSPDFALSHTTKQQFDYRTELGSAWDRLLETNSDSTLSLHAKLGWLHNYSNLIVDQMTFSAFSGSDFKVFGASPPKDAAHLKLGLERKAGAFVLSFDTDGTYAGSNANSYGGSLSAAFRW
jgi:autotransporter-associated beta strand protein